MMTVNGVKYLVGAAFLFWLSVIGVGVTAFFTSLDVRRYVSHSHFDSQKKNAIPSPGHHPFWLLAASTSSTLDQQSLAPDASTSSTTLKDKKNQEVREEIRLMRFQAANRLGKLEESMQELQQERLHLKEDERMKVMQERIIQTQQQFQQQQQHRNDRIDESSSAKQKIARAVSAITEPLNRYERLDNTRWKLVFNLGREPGTWMPASWGASGTRLRFEIIADFTSDPSYEMDVFFLGVAGTKALKIVDAWMFPTMMEPNSTNTLALGRRQINVAKTGTFKILRGLGPRGTDIVRFCIDIADDHVVHDDVKCPVGRLYVTCGYFCMEKQQSSTAVKDYIAAEHRAAMQHYEQVKLENDQDSNFMNKIGRVRELFLARRNIDQLSVELHHARQVQPNKSELRFSRDRNVALSREGGVSLKKDRGFAVEYHILGSVEVASINKNIAPSNDESFDD